MNTQSTSAIRAHQEGSIVVILAIAIVMLIALLGSIQIGYTAYMKRELQKTADMVALSAVQNLQTDGCDLAKASSIAHANDKAIGALESSQMQCGTWDSKEPPGDRFKQTTEDQRAVQITLNKTPTSFLPVPGNDQPISAYATAISTEPAAAFSVSSTLLSLEEDKLLGALLKAAGLQAEELSVLSSSGLVTASITPARLLDELNIPISTGLGIGTPSELAKLDELTVADILSATASIVDASGVLETDVSLLSAVEAILDLPSLSTHVPIKLFGESGIIALAKAGESTELGALETSIQVSELLAATLGLAVANEQNAIDLNLNDTTGTFSLAHTSVQVIEPPTIAAGPPGTTAHSAQIRASLNLSTNTTIDGGFLPLVIKLLLGDILATEISLPIVLDFAHSAATLENVCKPNSNQAEISVKASAVNLCIGQIAGGSNASLTNACFDAAVNGRDDNLKDVEIVRILGLVTLNSHAAVSVLEGWDIAPQILTAPESVDSTKIFNSGAQLNLNKTISDGVIEQLLGNMKIEVIFIPIALKTILTPVSSLLSSLIAPLSILIDQIVQQIFDITGLNINQSNVTLQSVQCGVPRLVQ